MFPFLFDFIEAKATAAVKVTPGEVQFTFPFLFDFIEAKGSGTTVGGEDYNKFPFLFDFIEAKVPTLSTKQRSNLVSIFIRLHRSQSGV